jgi:hypothetical protein
MKSPSDRWKQKMKDTGHVLMQLWVPAGEAEAVRRYVARKRAAWARRRQERMK